MVLVAFARAQAAFDFIYAVDDYRQIIGGLSSIYELLLKQGRFGTYWLSKLFDIVGFDPMRAPFVTIVISVFLSTWAANLVLRLWTYELSDIVRALLIAVIAAHPFTAEILTFRGIAIYHILAFTLVVVAVAISGRSVWRILVSSLVFSTALTLYQIPLNYISVFVCFDVALRAIRHLMKSERVPVDYTLHDRSFYDRFLTIFVGCAFYFVLLKISTQGVPPLGERSAVVESYEIPGRLLYGLNALYGHFITGTIYGTPLVPKAILAVPLLFVGVTLGEILIRARDPRNTAIAIAIVVATPVIAGFAMLGAPLFFAMLWFPPRMLPQIGLVWAGVTVMALTVCRVMPRQFFTAALGVVAFSFIAQNNQIFIDQARVATRDHNLALRLIERLEGQPNFTAMKYIALVGGRDDSSAPIPTGMWGFNDSNLSHPWAVAPMLTEITGIAIKSPPNDEAKAEAERYCQGRSHWPARDAAIIQGELAIVCLQTGGAPE
nr:glucosyltransferase domain-containing protein [Rhizobium sp. BK538]